MTLNEQQESAKAAFERSQGTWNAGWDSLLRLDPAFVAAYADFAGVPWQNNHLSGKVKAFIALAADAAATHLYRPGMQEHLAMAIRHGATREELVEVIELISTVGIHASNVGVPVLLEVLEEEGMREGPVPLDARREALKARFIDNRGYWHSSWEGLLELDPELFEAYVSFSSVPWRTGVLEPVVKEFMYCAFDAAATHLYVPGLKLHMRNALRYGATAAQLMELLEIVSLIGIHGALEAAPLLEQALERSAAPQ
ncbi:carboxymuconolactone decarboxylase family protein [Pseudomonas sp. GD03842]|uniref:carboxymuconolactone decarboxylase family protein n=1 Tax=unclassified Pseudomonas TaxID=196821 RepID=UPI000D39725B|nr:MULTISPECIES: carboxymuconolactone decarboxylase family protein [unclassified Pseudomonas]MDH0745023.1 carboxymuconolactone decarboxylase family protein [Pseudomonas sp. GD03842]RAU48119.1 gamma-carboxymuconolactone decarboxylase [Pseudomonas sp. RIT 409]RAU55183.1 gamma-carboxymuconolactone decarboxylase [Pseudomonas sp. RIT 412]